MKKEQIIMSKQTKSVYIHIGSKHSKHIASQLHIHSQLEFLFVPSGRIKCFTPYKEIIANENEIIFINSNVPHTTEFLEDGTAQSFIQFVNPYKFENFPKYLSAFLKQSATPVCLFNDESPIYLELVDSLKQIFDKSGSNTVASDYYITSYMYRILSSLYEAEILSTEKSFENINSVRKLIPVFEYIENNYKEHLTLESLSRVMHLNKDYFNRLFKKVTGTTAMDYVNIIRVYVAEELLKSGMNVTEVYERSGFSSVSYFCTTFKKLKGYTPSSYKNFCNRSSSI